MSKIPTDNEIYSQLSTLRIDQNHYLKIAWTLYGTEILVYFDDDSPYITIGAQLKDVMVFKETSPGIVRLAATTVLDEIRDNFDRIKKVLAGEDEESWLYFTPPEDKKDEVDELRKKIHDELARHVPREFFEGGQTYSASDVAMRMAEKKLGKLGFDFDIKKEREKLKEEQESFRAETRGEAQAKELKFEDYPMIASRHCTECSAEVPRGDFIKTGRSINYSTNIVFMDEKITIPGGDTMMKMLISNIEMQELANDKGIEYMALTKDNYGMSLPADVEAKVREIMERKRADFAESVDATAFLEEWKLEDAPEKKFHGTPRFGPSPLAEAWLREVNNIWKGHRNNFWAMVEQVTKENSLKIIKPEQAPKNGSKMYFRAESSLNHIRGRSASKFMIDEFKMDTDIKPNNLHLGTGWPPEGYTRSREECDEMSTRPKAGWRLLWTNQDSGIINPGYQEETKLIPEGRQVSRGFQTASEHLLDFDSLLHKYSSPPQSDGSQSTPGDNI